MTLQPHSNGQTLKHYKVIYKVIMDNMESEEQALSEALKSIRENIENGELESCTRFFLKLVEISDEDANDGRI